MATEAEADDERLMRRAIAESRLAVEEDNAMVRHVCMFDFLVLEKFLHVPLCNLLFAKITHFVSFDILCDLTCSLLSSAIRRHLGISRWSGTTGSTQRIVQYRGKRGRS